MRYYNVLELDAAQTEAPLTLHVDAPSGLYSNCVLIAVMLDGYIEIAHEGVELKLLMAHCKVIKA